MEAVEKAGYKELENGILVPLSLVRDEPVKIRAPKDALPLLLDIQFAEQEHFAVLTLDAAHQVIRKRIVTIGLVNSSQIHPRETFRPAVADGATGIIVAHNHPSGSLEASVDDLLATRRLAEAGRILGIPLVDHLILSPQGIKSLRESFPDYFGGAK